MQIALLGSVTAEHDGHEVPLGAPRQRAVLAMLALAPGRVVGTDHLVDGLWGEEPPRQPLASLQVYVHGLRKAFESAGAGAAILVSRAPGYLLDLPASAVDIGGFEALWDRSRAASRSGDLPGARRLLDEALAVWRGPALSDLRGYSFAEATVAGLDEAHVAATEDRLDLLLALGEHAKVVAEVEGLVRAHPTRERLWGQLMLALYRADRQADALSAYARARDRLADELGIDPGQALRQLELGILRHDPQLAAPPAAALAPEPVASLDGAGPRAASATQVRPRRQARVPAALTPTYGRDDLAGELGARLHDESVRLVSLVGPGGSGKTRLAAVVAEQAGEAFPGGAYFLAASPEQSGAELLGELARAFGGSEAPEPTVSAAADAVADALPMDRVLVILDNLESVADAAYAVEALVKATTDVTVLTTSRLPLRLSYEVEIAVPPLPVPTRGVTAEAALASPAVTLFVNRAQLVNRGFRLDETTTAPVVDLCRLLDGVPLAIELAAARMRLLTPSVALERLRRGLDILAASPGPAGPAGPPAAEPTGSGSSTPRQGASGQPGPAPSRSSGPPTPSGHSASGERTLSGTIEWSLAQLDSRARALLADLCVFEDGFGLEALEAVTAGGSGGRPEGGGGADADEPMDDPIELLGLLLDSGILRLKETQVELRYQVLGPVRAYLSARAGNATQVERVRERHLAWLSAWVEREGGRIDGPDAEIAAARFADEHGDIAALVEWACATGRYAEAARLAVGSHGYWSLAGRLREGLELLGQVAAGELPQTLHARVEVASARLAYQLGDHERAETLGRSAASVLEPGSADWAAASCHRAAALTATGRIEEGRALASTALEAAERVGDPGIQAVALSVLAIGAAMSGDFDAERAHYLRRLEVARRHGDRTRVADTVNTLAEIDIDEGDLASARDHVTEALRLAGDHRPIERRDALITSARIHAAAGNAPAAVADLREAVDLAAVAGQSQALAQCARVAGCLVAGSSPRVALRLYAVAGALAPVPSEDGDPFESDLRAGVATARSGVEPGEAERVSALATAERTDFGGVLAVIREALTQAAG